MCDIDLTARRLALSSAHAIRVGVGKLFAAMYSVPYVSYTKKSTIYGSFVYFLDESKNAYVIGTVMYSTSPVL